MRDIEMKNIITTTLIAMAVACHAASLEENVQNIEKAKIDIEAAIQAKGGTARGGLVNAAEDIINIPDKIEYEKDYVAWSNATVVIHEVLEQTEQFTLVPWLQSDGTQEITLTGVKANQNTCCHVIISEYVTESVTAGFLGNTESDSARWGLHRYSNQVSFPYGSDWNDYKASTTSERDIQTKTNQFWFGGTLKSTVTARTFETAGPIGVLNIHNWGDGMKGKLHRLELSNALTADGVADLVLVPAVDTNGVPCLLDLNWNAGSLRQHSFYNTKGSDIQVGEQTNTATVVVVQHEVTFGTMPVPYETNVVGAADNKLIVDNTSQFIYDRMAAQIEGNDENEEK